METLLKISENANPQVIYDFWMQNIDKLDDNLVHVINILVKNTFSSTSPQEAALIAGYIVIFSNLIAQFPLGNIAINQAIGITGYKIALTVFTFEAFPQQWAMIWSSLAIAYSHRIRGERAENLELAIACWRGWSNLVSNIIYMQ